MTILELEKLTTKLIDEAIEKGYLIKNAENVYTYEELVKAAERLFRYYSEKEKRI